MSMNLSPLKFPPLKQNISKLPERLIYAKNGTYNMCSAKTGKVIGRMFAKPFFVDTEEYYPKMKNYWAYYISGLIAYERRKGVGKDFEKLIRKIAKEDEKCEGRIFLRAFNTYDRDHKASSTWWHARGYVGCDKAAENDLQRHLKGQTRKYGDWYMDMDMYLPVKSSK